MLQSSMAIISNPISQKNLKQPFPLPDDALQEMITFGQLTLETYFLENMNGQPTDGLGTPNHCHINTSFEPLPGEQKRQLKEQGEPNPSIFLCLKQSRNYQNALAFIQNVKKTALVIFCFSSFDTN